MFFDSMNRGLINGGRHFGSRFLGFLGAKRLIFLLLIGELQSFIILVWFGNHFFFTPSYCNSHGPC